MSDEPQGEEDLPPYVIEGARSGRSKCKTCRRAIAKDTLRIGILINGPFGQGYLWNHLKCAARTQFERVEEAYGLEAWNEAKEAPESLPSLEDLKKHQEKAAARKDKRREIPYAEFAPSGRSKCKTCGEPIEKGTLRVVLGRRIEFGNQERTSPTNVHPGCVAREINSPECNTPAEGLSESIRANSEGSVDPKDLEQLSSVVGDL